MIPLIGPDPSKVMTPPCTLATRAIRVVAKMEMDCLGALIAKGCLRGTCTEPSCHTQRNYTWKATRRWMPSVKNQGVWQCAPAVQEDGLRGRASVSKWGFSSCRRLQSCCYLITLCDCSVFIHADTTSSGQTHVRVAFQRTSTNRYMTSATVSNCCNRPVSGCCQNRSKLYFVLTGSLDDR